MNANCDETQFVIGMIAAVLWAGMWAGVVIYAVKQWNR